MTYIPQSAAMPESRRISLAHEAYISYRLLQIIFVVAPIVAGIDKFFYMLTDWSKYLSPYVVHMVGDAHGFMKFAGIVEIIAGIGVALKPKYFGFVVSAWMLGIIINLLSMGAYYDIALRDLGLAGSAFALGWLALYFDRGNMGGLIRHDTVTSSPSR
jgi:hypothetical protein